MSTIDKPRMFCGLPGKQTLHFAQKDNKVGKMGQDDSLLQCHQSLFRQGSHSSATAWVETGFREFVVLIG